jgi:quinol monooxygenase YgiN
MITIVAKSVVLEGKAEEFKALARKLVAESQKESGCLSYDLYQEVNQPNVLTFIEVWKDKEAIEKHNASRHFTHIVPKLGALREGPAEVHLYQKLSE